MTSRTMMLAELRLLLAALPETASVAAYRSAIVDDNALLKESVATRRSTARHLVELYALDPAAPIFRLLRRLWGHEDAGHPMLACLCANARDALLRRSAQAVLPVAPGATVSPATICSALSEAMPGRFSPATLGTIARNAASSWMQSGHLRGRPGYGPKTRGTPTVTPAVAAYALALGFLAGARRAYLLDTYWTSLLDAPADILDTLAFEAGRHGWITYRRIGDVVDFGFSELLGDRKGMEA